MLRTSREIWRQPNEPQSNRYHDGQDSPPSWLAALSREREIFLILKSEAKKVVRSRTVTGRADAMPLDQQQAFEARVDAEFRDYYQTERAKHEIVAVDDIYAVQHFGHADVAIIDLSHFTLRERKLRHGEDRSTVLRHLREAREHIGAAAKRFVPSGQIVDLSGIRTSVKKQAQAGDFLSKVRIA